MLKTNCFNFTLTGNITSNKETLVYYHFPPLSVTSLPKKYSEAESTKF